MITITLNGEKKVLQKNLKLSDLLKDFSLTRGKIAVERNLEVVRRKDWNEIEIQDGDKIEIIHFVGGG